MNNNLNKLAHNDDEKRLLARLDELLQKAVHGNVGQSDFLDLRQQKLAKAAAINEKSINYHLDGGYEDAERKRLLVYPEWEADPNTRIAYLRINPKEFKEQSIGHRDYLGTVLNLGIKREKLGDIVVQNGEAFLIVDVSLEEFICQQLNRVKNSSVSVEIIPREEFVFQSPELTLHQITLASLRLDAAIAGAFNLSRSAAEGYIESGNVKINQMDVLKCSATLQCGDLISVRGLGRFRFEELDGISRKGRSRVTISHW